MVLGGAVLISFSAVFVRLAHVSPTMSGFYRNLIGGLVLAGILFWRRERIWKDRFYFLGGLLCGFVFALDIFTWHASIHYIGPGLATILANFQVFFMAAFGVILFKERISPRLMLAMPLAVAGLFLLAGVQWQIAGRNYQDGVILGIVSALFYAIYILSLRQLQSGNDVLSPMSLLAMVSFSAAGFLGVTAWYQGDTFVIPDLQTMSVLIAYGILCQVIGWILISRGLPRIPSSLAGLLILVQPALAFIWDILIFNRPVTPSILLGALIALLAIYLGTTVKRAPGTNSSKQD